MSEPDQPAAGVGEAVRPALQLVRLPVDKAQTAVAFLHERSQGVMDLIAHFWERLAHTPPLQRSDLHLVVATAADTCNVNINIISLDVAKFSGAMLYVPKAHRADVLALDSQTAAAFAAYITHQGAKALKSDNGPAAGAPADVSVTTGATSHYNNGTALPLTDLSASGRGTPTATEVPTEVAPAAAALPAGGGGGGGAASTNGGAVAKVPIDFLTGHADGVAWMTPLLLPVVHRRSPARQVVNVVMQLPPAAKCQPDANVRIARESDIPTLNRWRRQYKEERGILFDADFDAGVQTQRIFVYDRQGGPNGGIVAAAKFDLELPTLIEIGGVYTFPEYRKQGFGAKIVSDLACRIRGLGKTPTLQVDEQNAPALHLYEKADWKPMGKLARVWLTG